MAALLHNHREETLRPGSRYVGRIDPISRRVLGVGDKVIICRNIYDPYLIRQLDLVG